MDFLADFLNNEFLSRFSQNWYGVRKVIWNNPKSTWKMILSCDGISILLWNDPKSTNFIFGSFWFLNWSRIFSCGICLRILDSKTLRCPFLICSNFFENFPIFTIGFWNSEDWGFFLKKVCDQFQIRKGTENEKNSILSHLKIKCKCHHMTK